MSKRWNKHDSLLFVLAGLPQEQMLLPYNIHFLCTSNLASPLEMCERVCQELREAEVDGIVAWDCELAEEVLSIPWVLGVLGDNLMQSELSSHIGLNGKCFCRMCKAHKIDKEMGLEAELAHVLQFMQVKPLATASGVKDKHLSFFHVKLKQSIASCKELNKSIEKPMMDGVREDIARSLEGLSFETMINPLLSLESLDLARDMPVEILHVVLLGVAKYFWRDAVSRLDSAGKSLLKTRLTSLEVLDLGISPVRGHTLVQYARSLTGRDFRIILQVAPAVLYGLLPAPAWKAWMALCHVAPLIFQPRIESIDKYIVRVWSPFAIRSHSIFHCKSYRPTSKLVSMISSWRQLCGPRGGLINQSSTSSCTFPPISPDLALRCSQQLKALSPLTMSSICEASTRTARPQAKTSGVL
ncbi:hypothetical protein BC834DRAFT_925517 [Gloeopeniophorella convolvens]|nr:hypothetical protein BC834DRAFT_925517 [Gloeopeniophorella convolvens]